MTSDQAISVLRALIDWKTTIDLITPASVQIAHLITHAEKVLSVNAVEIRAQEAEIAFNRETLATLKREIIELSPTYDLEISARRKTIAALEQTRAAIQSDIDDLKKKWDS